MVTHARHELPNRISKNVRLECGISRSKTVTGTAASIVCLLVGGSLGILFGSTVAVSMGYAGTSPSTEIATVSDAETLPVQPTIASVTAAQPSVSKQVSAATTELPAIPQAKPKVAASIPEIALAAPIEIASESSSPHPSAPVLQAVSQPLSDADEILPSSSAAIYRIEGDATVVDYDATAGTIEVRDGRTFLLAGLATQTETAQWQDYMGNVHYSCDQGGNCTLSPAGAIVPSARLLAA